VQASRYPFDQIILSRRSMTVNLFSEVFDLKQKRQNTAALQDVAAIPDAIISLAFWSAVVLHRFSTQQINPAHLSNFSLVQNG
jgi:hypothetical protein